LIQSFLTILAVVTLAPGIAASSHLARADVKAALQTAESPDTPRSLKVRAHRETKRKRVKEPDRPQQELESDTSDEATEIATRLLKRIRRGALVFSNARRDTDQIRQMAENGSIEGPCGEQTALSIKLLKTLDRLTARASSKRPLVVNSMYRPLGPGRPREPHGHGLAIDIGAYWGHRIQSADPDSCVAALIAIIKALGPGDYRMGLPRPPGSETASYMPNGDQAGEWPFFPPPRAILLEDRGDLPSRGGRGKSGAARVTIRWALHSYAPLEDVGNRRVRSAIEAAIVRGANIHSLFPDGVNHIHLDVREER